MSDFVRVKQEVMEDDFDMYHFLPPRGRALEPTRQLSQLEDKNSSRSVNFPWLDIDSAYTTPTKMAPLFSPITNHHLSFQDNLSDNSHHLSEDFAHPQSNYSIDNLLPSSFSQHIPLPSIERDLAEENNKMANSRNGCRGSRMNAPTPRTASLASRRESQFSPVDRTSSATAMDTTGTPSRGSVESTESSGRLKRQERVFDLDALPLAENMTIAGSSMLPVLLHPDQAIRKAYHDAMEMEFEKAARMQRNPDLILREGKAKGEKFIERHVELASSKEALDLVGSINAKLVEIVGDQVAQPESMLNFATDENITEQTIVVNSRTRGETRKRKEQWDDLIDKAEQTVRVLKKARVDN